MKLILGDARIELEKIQPNSIDVVITSPPYWNERGESRGNGLGVESDSIAYVRSLTTILNKVKPLLTTGGSMWIVIGDDPRNETKGLPAQVRNLLLHSGWEAGYNLSWDKRNGKISKHKFIGFSSYDWIMQFHRKSETPNTVKGIDIASEFNVPLSKRFANSDTLAYPEQLVEALLMYSCKKSSTILDPFVGTGTTVLVAERLGHTGIGIDLSQEELEIAKERLTSKGTMLYKEEAGDRPRLQLGGTRRVPATTRLAKNFGGAVSSFETPGLGMTASDDDEEEKGNDLVPIDEETPWHMRRDLSLENCLKKVENAATALLKEWVQPNQIGYFEEPEEEQLDKPKDQTGLNEGSWITGERHGELHALDNPGPG